MTLYDKISYLISFLQICAIIIWLIVIHVQHVKRMKEIDKQHKERMREIDNFFKTGI